MITKYPAARLDIIFVHYWYPSIKDIELHEVTLNDYSNSERVQIRPSDFTKEKLSLTFSGHIGNG